MQTSEEKSITGEGTGSAKVKLYLARSGKSQEVKVVRFRYRKK